MAQLNDDVQGFLNWLPYYLKTCGDQRRKEVVTLDDLSNPQLRGYGFLTGATDAYLRYINPPPPPRPLEEVLTTEGLALLKRQTDEVQTCVLDTIHRQDPGPGQKMDDELLKTMLEFIAGPAYVQ